MNDRTGLDKGSPDLVIIVVRFSAGEDVGDDDVDDTAFVRCAGGCVVGDGGKVVWVVD